MKQRGERKKKKRGEEGRDHKIEGKHEKKIKHFLLSNKMTRDGARMIITVTSTKTKGVRFEYQYSEWKKNLSINFF